MGIDYINDNQNTLKWWIDKDKDEEQKYYNEHPNSLILCFEEELRTVGFDFEISNQTIGFMPKHKKTILPIALKYYKLAKKQQKYNEQVYFINFFGFKGFDEVVPQLLEDYYSERTPDLNRWFISDCLYRIRAKHYIKEYLDIVLNRIFGLNRQMIVLLLGKLKEESAIPILVELLEDEEVRLHAIRSLDDFKRQEFRCYFERFQNSNHPGWRKYAKAALKRLDLANTGDGYMRSE